MVHFSLQRPRLLGTPLFVSDRRQRYCNFTKEHARQIHQISFDPTDCEVEEYLQDDKNALAGGEIDSRSFRDKCYYQLVLHASKLAAKWFLPVPGPTPFKRRPSTVAASEELVLAFAITLLKYVLCIPAADIYSVPLIRAGWISTYSRYYLVLSLSVHASE